MSDHLGVKPFGVNAKVRDAMQPHQSLWLAHWMHTSHSPESLSSEPSTIGNHRKDDNTCSKQKLITSQISDSSRKGKRIAIDVGQNDPLEYRNAKRGRKRMLEASFDAFHSGAQVFTETTEIMRSEMPSGNPVENWPPACKGIAVDSLPVSKLSEPPFEGRNFTYSYPTTDPVVCCNDLPGDGKAGSVATVVDRSSKYLLQEDNSLKNQQKAPDLDSKREDVLISRSFQEKIAGLTSTSVLYGVNNGAAKTGSSFRKEQENVDTCQLKDENYNYHDFRAYLADMDLNRRLVSRDSGGSHVGSMQGGSYFINVGKDDGRFNNNSAPMSLPCRNHNTDLSRLEGSRYCELESSQRFPAYRLQDVETLRICTTVDSMEQTTRGPSKFSKTTQHMLITKKTDFNLSHRGDEMVENSTKHTNLKGNTFDRILNQPSFIGRSKDQQKLQELRDLSDRKKKDVHTMSTRAGNRFNESSAETGIMFFHMYQPRSSFAGGTSHLSDKNPAAVASSSKAVEMGRLRSEPPYPNEELRTAAAVARSSDDKELSTSPTESLGVENFLSQIKQQPDYLSCNTQPEIPVAADSSSSWVKRLRISASESQALASNPWKAREESCGENINKLVTRIMSYQKTSSEPTLGKHLGKGTLGNRSILLANREAPSGESVEDHQDTSILSHFWIHRLRRKREVPSETSKPSSQMMGESLSYEVALDEEFKKKQLPSIAAMAMMGKAMVNLRPLGLESCESTITGMFMTDIRSNPCASSVSRESHGYLREFSPTPSLDTTGDPSHVYTEAVGGPEHNFTSSL
ncbi:hypothetical protein H6P81_009659 [Aristolochia fimbriata]|uniref:Uncharacterized protein n=1 Tax=Aristolochia fimbriata TaxID=158543 RepID=A0AAV7EMP8_ARIFI|nr:hypothetical protein H6P81_009659 [Aristolochia fimbriata]